jgi:anaerobic selenocysteine-containing dehydrogenase
VFVQWGSGIEISNYDDAGRIAVDNAQHADTFINIDARLGSLSKEADYWLGIRPGTDGALAMAWTKIIMEKKLFNDLYVRRWTNASFLVCEEIEPSGWEETITSVGLTGVVQSKQVCSTILLKESDIKEGGDPHKFIIWDEANSRFTYLDSSTGLWEGEPTFRPKYHDLDYITRAGMVDLYDWEKSEGKFVESGRPGLGKSWLPDPSLMPVVDGQASATVPALYTDSMPEITLKDGRRVKPRSVWEHYYDNCKDFTLEYTSEVTGIEPQLIEEACLKYAQTTEDNHGTGAINYAVTHEHTGNAVKAIHCLEAIDALMANIDIPGGHHGMTRAESIFPDQTSLISGQFLRVGTKNRVTDAEQAARKICSFPLQNQADATEVFDAMDKGEPYRIVGALTQAGSMLCQTNLHLAWDGVSKLDFFTNWNLWQDPISSLADLLLPENHWLEVECSRCAQGSGGYYGAHIQCVESPADTKWGIDIVGEWYKRAGLEFWVGREDGGDPWEMGDYLRSRAVASTGMTWQEFAKEFQENGWFDARTRNPEGYGYRRYETGWMCEPFKARPGFSTSTTRHELWVTNYERLMKDQIEKETGEPYGTKYALPYYVAPKSSPSNDAYRKLNNLEDYTPDKYPYILSTGRRIPVYFHSEHRQLPWCREQWLVPRLEINPTDAEKLGLKQGDWAWIETPFSKIRQCVDIFSGVAEGQMNAEHSWWFPELDQPGHGFELCGCNCLVDPYSQCEGNGAPQLRGYLANVYKATPENSPFNNPVPCGNDGTEIIHSADDPRLKEWLPDYSIREEA